jgi:hypothetical protein
MGVDVAIRPNMAYAVQTNSIIIKWRLLMSTDPGDLTLDITCVGQSQFPSQVFFPIAEAKDGWSRLVRNMKA